MPVTFVGHIYNIMEGALSRLIFKFLLTLYNLHLHIVMNYMQSISEANLLFINPLTSQPSLITAMQPNGMISTISTSL